MSARDRRPDEGVWDYRRRIAWEDVEDAIVRVESGPYLPDRDDVADALRAIVKALKEGPPK